MDKEQTAIIRLQEAARMSEKFYKAPLIVTTSGGKDSSVCVELALRAGINFEVMHNHTTADAPETVYFVRSEFKRLEDKGIKCYCSYPIYKGKRTSMWSLIPTMRIPPTCKLRYCCSILKESGGKGRYITTGVRWAESVSRRNKRGIYETNTANIKNKIILNNDNDDKRKLFEHCMLQRKAICNPIIDWTDDDVWDFIEDAEIPVNPLYKCGFSRVGCIGCPMAGTKRQYEEFSYWPAYKKLYINTFARMLEYRKINQKKYKDDWITGEDVFHWWINDGILPGQISIDEYQDIMDNDL